MFVIVTSYGHPFQCHCVHIFGQGACPALVLFDISLSTQCSRLCDYKTKVHVGLKRAAGALTGIVANVQPAACSLLLCVTGEEEH